MKASGDVPPSRISVGAGVQGKKTVAGGPLTLTAPHLGQDLGQRRPGPALRRGSWGSGQQVALLHPQAGLPHGARLIQTR